MHLAAQLLNEPQKKNNSQTQPAAVDWNALVKLLKFDCFILFHIVSYCFIEGSLEVKLPTIWTDEKQSRGEAERRGRLEERR